MPYKDKEKAKEAAKKSRLKHKARGNLTTRLRRKEKRRWVNEIKKRSWCENCGTHDTDVLEAHHKDRTQKRFHISEFGDATYESIKAEIAKCVWLCANCHKKITKREGNQWTPIKKLQAASGACPCEIVDMFKRKQSS